MSANTDIVDFFSHSFLSLRIEAHLVRWLTLSSLPFHALGPKVVHDVSGGCIGRNFT